MIIKKLFCLNEKNAKHFLSLKNIFFERNSNFDKEEILYFETSHGKFKLILQVFTKTPFRVHIVSLHSWGNTGMQVFAPRF